MEKNHYNAPPDPSFQNVPRPQSHPPHLPESASSLVESGILNVKFTIQGNNVLEDVKGTICINMLEGCFSSKPRQTCGNCIDRVGEDWQCIAFGPQQRLKLAANR